MNINPTALLAGAVPPKKECVAAASSFDEPAVANTLENVVKVWSIWILVSLFIFLNVFSVARSVETARHNFISVV